MKNYKRIIGTILDEVIMDSMTKDEYSHLFSDEAARKQEVQKRWDAYKRLYMIRNIKESRSRQKNRKMFRDINESKNK